VVVVLGSCNNGRDGGLISDGEHQSYFGCNMKKYSTIRST
jgi:hypothetical protein